MTTIDLTDAVKDSELTAATSISISDTLSIIQGGVNKKATADLLPSNTKLSYNALAAFAIDITKDINTKSVSTNATFTFAGTPTTGQRTSLKITTDSTDRIVTLPSFFCRNRHELITEAICHRDSTYLFEFEYTGSRWESSSYSLIAKDYNNTSISIGTRIGENVGGTASVFIGDFIGWGTRQGVAFGDRMSTVTDSVLIGPGAGECVTTGNGLVAIGRLAMGKFTGGSQNTAIGDTSLKNTTTGQSNSALGYDCGAGNVTGDWNVFVGAFCGGVTNDKGDFNVLVGPYAGDGPIGDYNTFIGSYAGSGAATTGSTNVGIGKESFNGLTSGSNNVGIGRQAGFTITTGTNNVFIGEVAGSATGVQKVDVTNSIAIGNGTYTTKNNQAVIGNGITETILGGKVYCGSSVVIAVSEITPGTTSQLVVSDTSATVITINGTGNYMSLYLEKTNATGVQPKYWAAQYRGDTALGNTFGAYAILGQLADNSYVVPFFCNSNGDVVLAGSSLGTQGKVGIGEAVPDYKLDVNGTFGFTPGSSVTPVDNGDVVFQLTSNTQLTIKAKGSDGTVRSVNLTLA